MEHMTHVDTKKEGKSHPEQGAQEGIQMGFESLQSGRLHNLSGNLVNPKD